jgi:hypothetical protein
MRLNCGKDVLNEEARYCPFCSAPLKRPIGRRSGKSTIQRTNNPITRGVLSVLASSYVVLFAFLVIISLTQDYWSYSNAFRTNLVLDIVLSVVAFAFGLTGSITHSSVEASH